jgi:hypothetical protein
MLRSELNQSWVQVILYYLYIMDPVPRYNINGSDIGQWGYDENDNLIIVVWFLTSITQPEISTLLSYNINDVDSWYSYTYYLPNEILTHQPFLYVNGATIQYLNLNASYEGCIIFNTTLKRIQYYNGTAFINVY